MGFTRAGICVNPSEGQKYSSTGKDFYVTSIFFFIPIDLS